MPAPYMIVIKGRVQGESEADARKRIVKEFERQLYHALREPEAQKAQPKFTKELSARAVSGLLKMGITTDEELYKVALSSLRSRGKGMRNGIGLKTFLEIADFISKVRDVSGDVEQVLRDRYEYTYAKNKWSSQFPHLFEG